MKRFFIPLGNGIFNCGELDFRRARETKKEIIEDMDISSGDVVVEFEEVRRYEVSNPGLIKIKEKPNKKINKPKANK